MKEKHSFAVGLAIFLVVSVIGYALMPQGNGWLRIASAIAFMYAGSVSDKMWEHWRKM